MKEDIELEGPNDFIFELPIDFGGTLSNDYKVTKDSLMAFDITKTSAAEAQKAYDAMQKPKPPSFKEFGGAFLGDLKLPIFPTSGSGVELEDVEFEKFNWDDHSVVPEVPEGFRIIWIDELFKNEDFKAKVEENLGEWSIF